MYCFQQLSSDEILQHLHRMPQQMHGIHPFMMPKLTASIKSASCGPELHLRLCCQQSWGGIVGVHGCYPRFKLPIGLHLKRRQCEWGALRRVLTC